MAKSRKKYKEKKSMIDQQNFTFDLQQWYALYYNQLCNIVFQMFEWRNLPDTIDPRFLERTLHEIGYIAFYDDEDFGKMCVRGAFQNISMYQEPIDYQSSMLGYNKSFGLYTAIEIKKLIDNQDSIDDYFNNIVRMTDQGSNMNFGTYTNYINERGRLGVFCANMFGFLGGNNIATPDFGLSFSPSSASSIIAINLFAMMLAENKITTLIAQNNLKLPFIIQTTEQNQLSAKNMINDLIQNKTAIFIDKDMMDDTFRVHPTGVANATEVLTNLNIARREIINEFLLYFGINNFGTDKKERLVTDEVRSNKESITHNLNKFLAPRQEACRIMNKLWNSNIEVGLRESIYTIIDSELGLEREAERHDLSADRESGV